MKNNIVIYLSLIVSVFLFFFLQTSRLNPIPIINLPINYLVVISLCISLFIPNIYQRVFLSLFCGLLIDFWFSSYSFYSLSLVIINNLIAIFSSKARIDKIIVTGIAFVGTVLIELINASLLSFCMYGKPSNPFVIYQHNIFKLAIGNTIFSLILFSFVNKYFLEKIYKSKRSIEYYIKD